MAVAVPVVAVVAVVAAVVAAGAAAAVGGEVPGRGRRAGADLVQDAQDLGLARAEEGGKREEGGEWN